MPNLDPSSPLLALFSRQVVEARRFFIDASSGNDGLVLGGGYERVSEAYTIDRRGVPFFAIELVVGGEGDADLASAAFGLRPGTLFAYDSRTPHRLTTSPDLPLTKYFLDLHERRSRPLFRRLGLAGGRAWQVRQWPDLARLFEEIIYHGGGSDRGRQAVCDALLRALLLHASQSLLPRQDATEAYDSYERCCTLIETRSAQLRSLGQLAGEAGLDVAYVCRLFKRFDRESPYRRLLRKRMTHAAARLCQGRASVRDIAREMGYADQFHFSRAFKTTLGASPMKFRQAHLRQAAVEA